MKDTLGELKDKSKELADTKVELAKVQQWCDTHKDNHENTKEEATALEKENKELKNKVTSSSVELGKINAAFEEQTKLKDHLQESLSVLQEEMKLILSKSEKDKEDLAAERDRLQVNLTQAEHHRDTHLGNHK